MNDYPYINTTGKLQEFLDKISDMGVPLSANTSWLPTIGFGSNNHRPILKILRFVGFLDGTAPTERWKQFRDETQAKRVMAEGIAQGYSELYAMYRNAHDRSDEELKNFFKGQMTAGEQVVTQTLSTFRTLCKFADFDGIETVFGSEIAPSVDNTHTITADKTTKAVDDSSIAHIQVNVHVQIDSCSSVDQIDAIFAGLNRFIACQEAEE